MKIAKSLLSLMLATPCFGTSNQTIEQPRIEGWEDVYVVRYENMGGISPEDEYNKYRKNYNETMDRLQGSTTGRNLIKSSGLPKKFPRAGSTVDENQLTRAALLDDEAEIAEAKKKQKTGNHSW
ncbi:MAG: hypothetical protein LBR78_03330 [Holosporales bacterium]|jgi:hypothetical protein|nr:hypothetical protein [Holosporales bacterium]